MTPWSSVNAGEEGDRLNLSDGKESVAQQLCREEVRSRNMATLLSQKTVA